ncbi:MAG: thiamine pyrophosphate-binding protein [Burkholderiales bacterium]|nr:thiamine pyrophosphate-binding protein [Burkholderiales bacterium]
MSESRTPMHAGEAVAEALREEGVERIYSVPGSHIHPIYDGLSRAKSVRFITLKTEPNTSLMADAYGRLTGKPGVCLVTAGPGGLNSMAGVAQAYGAASPMVHLAGAVPLTADKEAFHGVDDPAFVHDMFRKITKWSARVERIEDIPGVMAKAFHICRSGRPGPVHVELPRVSDYSEHILQEGRTAIPAYRPVPAVVPRPDAAAVDRMAQRLMAARSPVIAAGKGVIRRRAMRELSELSLKLQAPVVHAQDAIGVIPESHPLFAGHFQHYRSHPLCVEALERTDLIFGIGLRAGTAEISQLRERAPERAMMLVGFDDGRNDGYRREDETVADPALFLAALLERLGGYQRPRDEAILARMERGKSALRARLVAENEPHRADRPIDPGVVMEALNDVLDEDAVVASDVGNCQMWARTFRRISNPESFMQSGVWNAMSYGLPTAMVAKMEFPERNVVGLAGDGAFLMTIGDLPTAAEYGANILMLVMNNGCFGQTTMQQQSLYGHVYGTLFQSPNFAEIARACGAEGIRVSDPKDVKDALNQGLAATKRQPALVEVMAADRAYPKL